MSDAWAFARERTAAGLRRLSTGPVTLTRTTRAAPTGETPAGAAGEVTATDVYALDAVVKGVTAEPDAGKTTLGIDLMLIVSPVARHVSHDAVAVSGTPEVALELLRSDVVAIGGVAKVIRKIERLPAAGDAVRFHVFVGA